MALASRFPWRSRSRAATSTRQKKSIRAPGTKAHTRDRVDDWAWPLFWKYAKTITLTTSVIFGDLNRWTASDWHRHTVGDGEPGFANQWRSAEPHEGLKLETRYPTV